MSEKQREGTLEKNRLENFDLRELIFVDANIFIDHGSANTIYGKSCEWFLERVESKNVVAITTTAVLDEVGYILSLLEGAKTLKTEELKKVRKKLKEDQKLAVACYEKVREYMKYILIEDKFGMSRDELMLELEKKGIEQNPATAESKKKSV